MRQSLVRGKKKHFWCLRQNDTGLLDTNCCASVQYHNAELYRVWSKSAQGITANSSPTKKPRELDGTVIIGKIETAIAEELERIGRPNFGSICQQVQRHTTESLVGLRAVVVSKSGKTTLNGLCQSCRIAWPTKSSGLVERHVRNNCTKFCRKRPGSSCNKEQEPPKIFIFPHFPH